MTQGLPGWIDWRRWDDVIRLKGVELDRPKHATHPGYPEIVYPIDYGFVPGTISADGEEQDIFVGSASNGLVAAIFTVDVRKGDKECKLIFNCTPEEIYLVNGFVNFNPSLMSGRLLMRFEMKSLWKEA